MKEMDRTRFEQIVASYGADAKRWPEHERADALAFAAREGADLRAAAALDALLDAVPAPAAPSDLLQARILRARPLPKRAAIGGLALLAASMIAGVLLGYDAGLNAPGSDDMDTVIAMAFDPDASIYGEVQ